MYQPKFYKTIDREKIADDARLAGFGPVEIFDEPDFVYPPHQHKQANLLIFLEGEMTLTVGGDKHICKPGDKLLIPAETVHFGKVGDKGCLYFWSQKKI